MNNLNNLGDDGEFDPIALMNANRVVDPNIVAPIIKNTVEETVQIPVQSVTESEPVVTEETAEQVTEEDVSDDDLPSEIFEEPAQFVTIDESAIRDVDYDALSDAKKDVFDSQAIDLPARSVSVTNAVFNRLDNLDIVSTESEREWARCLSASQKSYVLENVYTNALQRVDADFRQGVDVNGKRLVAGVPRAKEVKNLKLTGEVATLMMANYVNGGGQFRVPLYNTGIWITFKALLESDIITLNEILLQDKKELGRSTYGLALSNMVSITTNRILTFMFDKILNTSVKDISKEDLLDIIKPQDIPSIISGIAGSIHPDGFSVKRACVDNPSKCKSVHHGVLDISKSLITNNKLLTEWQKVHMSSTAAASRSKEDVLRYQDELLAMASKVITLTTTSGKEIKFEISSKEVNLKTYNLEGSNWQTQISQTIRDSLTEDIEPKRREKFILNTARATYMRNFAHFVTAIFFDTHEITDRNTINTQLDYLSSDDVLREDFIKEVLKYIDDSTLTILAIASYSCPDCGAYQSDPKDERKNHPTMIPLDPIQLFFLPSRSETVADRDAIKKHISDHDFGIIYAVDPRNENRKINVTNENFFRFIASVIRQKSDVEAHLLLMEWYDVTFGIYDHINDKSSPFALMCHSEVENTDSGLFDELLDTYTTCRIKDWYGLTFLEFYNLTRKEKNKMVSKSLKLNAKKSAEEADVESKLRNSLGH